MSSFLKLDWKHEQFKRLCNLDEPMTSLVLNFDISKAKKGEEESESFLTVCQLDQDDREEDDNTKNMDLGDKLVNEGT
jgi:hypothetical protein